MKQPLFYAWLSLVSIVVFVTASKYINKIPDQKLPQHPPPRGFVISYQAGITNNMTRIGNVVIPGPVFTEVLLNQSLQHIQSDTNVTKGSVTILNAFPIY